MTANNTCPDCGMFMTASEAAAGCCASCRNRKPTAPAASPAFTNPTRSRKLSLKAIVVVAVVGWVAVTMAMQVLVKSPESKLLAEYTPKVNAIRNLVESLPDTNASVVEPVKPLDVTPDLTNTRFASADAILNPADKTAHVGDDWGVKLAEEFDPRKTAFDVVRKRMELGKLLNFRYLAVVRFVDWTEPTVNGRKYTSGGGTVRVDLLDVERKQVVASFNTIVDQSRERLVMFGGTAGVYTSPEEAVTNNLRSLLDREIRTELNRQTGSEFKTK